MIQRFIEFGEGYSDIYELIEIARSNQHRLAKLLALHTIKNEQQVTSLVVILEPVSPGNFQPLYICREGIPNPHEKPNQRYTLFEQLSKECGKTITELVVKPSNQFNENILYYQYLIGILRMNHFIAPLS
ncbi:DUF7147 family protein [Bacillus taeanensis]|uniref:Methylthioribose kinase n=1 Tax=Bacillus taeanensis TaxID=273032 RepID=A0A366Y1Z9_9BACI|nr:methylthioribose kinase [Bacillus taeanensis]RBW70231.1 methylthioribose kinase [Bacillus taeanensis]